MGHITVNQLGKAYKQYGSRWGRLAEWLLPGKQPRHRLKWVLQDIAFQVAPGEAVGIIGINGAGKSTLLKLITGTSQPSTGYVHIGGRVAAQDILVHDRWPVWSTLWPVAVLAAVLCLLAMRLFRKRAGEMVDQL